MRNRTNGAKGVIAVVLTWGLVWAMPGGVIELLANLGTPVPGTDHVDMWPQTLGIPGTVGGVIFVALLATVGRWRTFETSSPALLAVLGVTVGLLVGGIFMSVGWIGGPSTVLELVFTTVMSVISAFASGRLVRHLERRQPSAGAGAWGIPRRS